MWTSNGHTKKIIHEHPFEKTVINPSVHLSILYHFHPPDEPKKTNAIIEQNRQYCFFAVTTTFFNQSHVYERYIFLSYGKSTLGYFTILYGQDYIFGRFQYFLHHHQSCLSSKRVLYSLQSLFFQLILFYISCNNKSHHYRLFTFRTIQKMYCGEIWKCYWCSLLHLCLWLRKLVFNRHFKVFLIIVMRALVSSAVLGQNTQSSGGQPC